MKKRFVGKVAVVTGAGIGRAAAVRFAGDGASVVAVDVDEAAFINGSIYTIDGAMTSF